ncbi:MAG: pyridoxal phosphate-dependent class II aminotransferase [Bacillota bacterium]|nr:pyridoxal phosphate-dependent class II aminotransferase [Bacillota bacterium]
MTEAGTNTHGGNIYTASQKYGIKKEDFIDYSANINPLGIPEVLKESIVSNIDALTNYPDPDCSELKMDISLYLNIDIDAIIIGNGAAEIIFLLFDELRPRKVLIPEPTFCEYEMAARRSGADVFYFELKEEEDFKLNINKLQGMMEGIDVIMLCNPNNPTSTLTSKDDLLQVLRFAQENGIKVIIDETFIELTIGANYNSMASYLNQFDNLFIIRALTKIFAIPGLRVGYGLGSPQLIKRLWKKKLPWSVNSFSCMAGCLFRDSEGYLNKTANWLSEEMCNFYNELALIDEFKVFKPNTNFVLLKILNEVINSKELRESMAFKGALIRDASNFRYLDDRFVRVAIKDRENNDRFLRVLHEVLDYRNR